MPKVRLSYRECKRGDLPEVCMFCGEPATARVKKTFSWHPQWVYILILVALLVALIVALVLTKKMTVRVPTCERHEGYWRRRTFTLVGSFLAVAGIGIGAIAFLASQGPNPNDDMTGILCGGTALLAFVWLIVAAIYSSQGVRPNEITDDFIRLGGVHEEFVGALEEDRRRNDDRRDSRRYGDERDDFDDEPADRPPPRRRDYEDDRPRRRSDEDDRPRRPRRDDDE